MLLRKYSIYTKIALYLFIAVSTSSSSFSQSNNFFAIENSDAIRDSINAIKFVNPNKAEKFAFEILEKYPDKKPNRVRAATFAALGQIYHIKGLTGPTLDYFSQSEEMFTEVLGSVPPWLQVSIGNIYFAQALYDKAEESYQESFNNFLGLSISEDIKLNPRRRSDRLQGMAVCKNNLAMIAEVQGKYDVAYQFFSDALGYRKERMQYDDLAHSYLHLADLELARDNLSMATIYCDSAEVMIDKLFSTSIEQFGASEENKNRYLGMSKQFKGEIYYKQGNTAQMYNSLEQAKAYYKNLPIELTGLLQIKADLSSEVNDLDISVLSINEGLEIAENQELSRQKERFLRTKMEVLKKKGDEEGALKANEQLLLINQKKVSSQNRNLLINMELREQLRINEEAIKEANEQRRQLFVLVLVGLIIFILIASTIRNQYITAEQQKIIAEQSKLVAELELKTTERELRSVSTSILEKNEMIETIKKDINYASRFLSDSDSKYLLNPLRTKLKDATSGSTDWDEFQKHFNKSYPGFLEKIASINKSLSIPDLRICAYLRSGQTTKEIAQMTGLSVRSVESRRYRLRKKLDLNRDTSLLSFISDIELVESTQEPS
jgi:tetratricopeptide (TPR) repeat protein/DNA-binding CsgD family transcriptional regulator